MDVIIQTDGERLPAVEAAVVDLGGTVGEHLDLVGGVGATIPEDSIGTLRSVRGVRAVTPG